MGVITLPTVTHDRLRLVAAALGLTEAATVSELLDRLTATRSESEENEMQSGVPIHAKYQGIRIAATFDLNTETVTVTSGDLTGETFNSPSRAAIEVVRSLNPHVSPNRNGWGFWVVDATSQPLQTLRRR